MGYPQFAWKETMIPAFYCTLWLGMTKTANKCGYALTLHGSMNRDLDLVAVPWTDDADSEQELIKQLCKRHGLIEGNSANMEKPHGRRAHVLMMSGQPYIDLSVMPRVTRRRKV